MFFFSTSQAVNIITNILRKTHETLTTFTNLLHPKNLQHTIFQHHSDLLLDAEVLSGSRSFTDHRRHNVFGSKINQIESAGTQTDACRFISMALLTSTMMVAEIVTGIVTGSLTLLSDALHMLSDLIALIIGFIAYRMANDNTTKTSLQHTMGIYYMTI